MKNTILLTRRELEVLELIAFENNTQDIAKKLFLSQHTVISHRRNILLKLNVRNVAGMIRVGFEKGILAVKKTNFTIGRAI